MNKYFVEIMLGSNTVDRAAKIDEATARVVAMLEDATITGIVDNPDFTGLGAPYLNRIVSGWLTGGTKCIKKMQERIANIENDMGRNRRTPQNVAIDIDVVTVTCGGETLVKARREFTTRIFGQLRQNATNSPSESNLTGM